MVEEVFVIYWGTGKFKGAPVQKLFNNKSKEAI